MTWKPSCKTGTATFSQDFIVPSDQILKRLFQRVVKEDGKVWKMKKFSIDDFEVSDLTLFIPFQIEDSMQDFR